VEVDHQVVAHPHGDRIPQPGEALEVAQGVWWIRMPLPFALDHINLWVLADGDGFTLVDTGYGVEATWTLWERHFDGVMAGRRVKNIVVTHYHPDHVGGAFGQHAIEGLLELMARNAVKVYANREEADGLKKVTGIAESDLARVDSGDKLKLGAIEIEFLHTPGHTPGSQCFRVNNALVSGDTLFIEGCGRVDLPGSNPEQMYYSLGKLRDLPDETILLPGHNYSSVPTARLGDVKAHNSYMRIHDLDAWRRYFARH